MKDWTPLELFLAMIAMLVNEAPRMAADPSTTARISFELGPDARVRYGVIWTEHEMPWSVPGLDRTPAEDEMLWIEADRSLAARKELHP